MCYVRNSSATPITIEHTPEFEWQLYYSFDRQCGSLGLFGNKSLWLPRPRVIIQNSHTPCQKNFDDKSTFTRVHSTDHHRVRSTESCSVLGLHLVSSCGLELAVYRIVGLVLFLRVFLIVILLFFFYFPSRYAGGIETGNSRKTKGRKKFL